MPHRDVIVKRLLTLFAEHFHVAVPTAETDLLETGIIDSLQLADLLLLLEQDFGFRIAFEVLELDDLRTLDRLAGLLAASAQTGLHSAADARLQEPQSEIAGGPA